ncbi:hypothetical protein CU098_002525, partial [Rhizopus stolonifer]
NVQDLLFTATPSKKDHGVISELHGKETNDQEQLLQVVLGKPKRSRLIDKETQWSDFFSQHSIIPIQKKEEPKTTTEKSSDHQTENDDAHMTHDVKNANQDVNDNTVQSVSRVTVNETVMDMAIDEDAVVKDSIIKDAFVKDAVIENAVVKVAVIENNDSTEHYTSTRVDQSETGTLNHKKLVTEENQSADKTREDKSFMLPPNKLPKKIRSHETIHALKYSGALDWIINGKDTDPRKHDIGKQSLYDKRQKNADAARRSRFKKAVKMEQLEDQVKTLRQHQSSLNTRLAILENEKGHLVNKENVLEERVRRLEKQLSEAYQALMFSK